MSCLIGWLKWVVELEDLHERWFDWVVEMSVAGCTKSGLTTRVVAFLLNSFSGRKAGYYKWLLLVVLIVCKDAYTEGLVESSGALVMIRGAKL